MDSPAKRYTHRIFPRSSDRGRTRHSISEVDGPLQRRKRLIAMLPHHNIGEVEDSYLAKEIALSTRRLTCDGGNVISCLNELKHRWARLLHSKIEGKPLRESHRVPGQHGWVDSGTMLLTGRSFIWANKLRSYGMPTNCRSKGAGKARSAVAPGAVCQKASTMCFNIAS